MKLIDQDFGDGADRRKRRLRLLAEFTRQAGGAGKSTNQMLRFTVGDLGLTRKSGQRLIKDAEFCGLIKSTRENRWIAI